MRRAFGVVISLLTVIGMPSLFQQRVTALLVLCDASEPDHFMSCLDSRANGPVPPGA